MFEITRRSRDFNPVREMLSFLNSEPMYLSSWASGDDDGNLALDVVEGDNEVIVRASMPGFRREEVEVHVENGVLSIKADHTEETEDTNERFYRRERRFGSVSRRVALPGMLEEGKAEAHLTDGVLTVHIPRAAEAKPKQIAIK